MRILDSSTQLLLLTAASSNVEQGELALLIVSDWLFCKRLFLEEQTAKSLAGSLSAGVQTHTDAFEAGHLILLGRRLSTSSKFKSYSIILLVCCDELGMVTFLKGNADVGQRHDQKAAQRGQPVLAN